MQQFRQATRSARPPFASVLARMPEPLERVAVWAAPPQGEGIVDAYVWEEAEDAFALELLSDVEAMPAELPRAELPVPVVLPDSLEQDRNGVLPALVESSRHL